MINSLEENVDLWLTFTNEIQNSELIDWYREILDDEERRQQCRFLFSEDQHRYLITRVLVRTVLSKYAPVSPKQWSFSKNRFGKPSIRNGITPHDISFNVSHTHGLVVIGVAHSRDLGVDVERVSARHASIDVAQHILGYDELASICALPKNMQNDMFFQYWTLKEAYIKARGMGLSIPLDQFCFHFGQDTQANVTFYPQINDHPSRWIFWQFRLSSDYLLSVCVKRSIHATQQPKIRKIIPFAMEEEFVGTLLHEIT